MEFFENKKHAMKVLGDGYPYITKVIDGTGYVYRRYGDPFESPEKKEELLKKAPHIMGEFEWASIRLYSGRPDWVAAAEQAEALPYENLEGYGVTFGPVEVGTLIHYEIMDVHYHFTEEWILYN